MTRQEWNDSSHALRKLLADVPFLDRRTAENRYVQYKFGIAWSSRYNMWQLYNGKTKNVIATFKRSYSRRPARIVIRFRRKSIYSGIISNWTLGDCEMVAIPSNRLGLHADWARQTLQSSVEESIRSFLELHHRSGTGRQRTSPDNQFTLQNILMDRLRLRIATMVQGGRLRLDSDVLDAAIYIYEMNLGEEFDSNGAFQELVAFLDTCDIPLTARGWSDWFNPAFSGFRDEYDNAMRDLGAYQANQAFANFFPDGASAVPVSSDGGWAYNNLRAVQHLTQADIADLQRVAAPSPQTREYWRDQTLVYQSAEVDEAPIWANERGQAQVPVVTDEALTVDGYDDI